MPITTMTMIVLTATDHCAADVSSTVNQLAGRRFRRLLIGDLAR